MRHSIQVFGENKKQTHYLTEDSISTLHLKCTWLQVTVLVKDTLSSRLPFNVNSGKSVTRERSELLTTLLAVLPYILLNFTIIKRLI